MPDEQIAGGVPDIWASLKGRRREKSPVARLVSPRVSNQISILAVRQAAAGRWFGPWPAREILILP